MTLDAYLKQHNITYQQFADRVGCSQPSISRFIAGRIPAADLMKRIIEKTDGHVTPNDFFGVRSAPARLRRTRTSEGAMA